MGKERLCAFSDGVLAIIITIMVLDFKVPPGDSLASLRPLLPVFLSYALSFVYIAIYWNNHHHMLYVTERVNGAILWANMHLLFWLSLIPFATAWKGENRSTPVPTALYGVVLLGAGVAYWILQSTILKSQGPDSLLAMALGRDIKGKISPALYTLAILFAFVNHWLADVIFIFVALMWLLPDPRIERIVSEAPDEEEHAARTPCSATDAPDAEHQTRCNVE